MSAASSSISPSEISVRDGSGDEPKNAEMTFCRNCPIIEQTADGINVGRCWYYLKDNKCPRHGDVKEAVDRYTKGEGLTLEREHKRKGIRL